MLKEQIEGDKLVIKNAQEELYKATEGFHSIERPILYRQKEILNKFLFIINARIEKEHDCTCCDPKLYRESRFTNNGVILWIDSLDDANDIREEHWTWEEVETILKEQL